VEINPFKEGQGKGKENQVQEKDNEVEWGKV
jgi:hypothetical protein